MPQAISIDASAAALRIPGRVLNEIEIEIGRAHV